MVIVYTWRAYFGWIPKCSSWFWDLSRFHSTLDSSIYEQSFAPERVIVNIDELFFFCFFWPFCCRAVPKFMKRMKVRDYKGRNVFGVPLLVIVQRTGQPLPQGIQQAMRYLRNQCLDQVLLHTPSTQGDSLNNRLWYFNKCLIWQFFFLNLFLQEE